MDLNVFVRSITLGLGGRSQRLPTGSDLCQTRCFLDIFLPGLSHKGTTVNLLEPVVERSVCASDRPTRVQLQSERHLLTDQKKRPSYM